MHPVADRPACQSQLSPWERRCAAIANMPAWDRAEALAAIGAPVAGVAGPEADPTLMSNHGGQFASPSPVAAEPGRPWARRDALRAELRRRYPGIRWQSLGADQGGYWTWHAAWRRAVAELVGMDDEDAYRPYRRANHLRCGARRGNGSLITYATGERRVAAMHCSERFCPSCSDREAGRIAHDALSYIQAVATAQAVPRFWGLVLTLPRELEGRMARGSDERRAVLHGVQALVRRLFDYRSRDTLCMYAAVHAVGDSDPMRNRYHIHVGALPVAVRRDRDGGRRVIVQDVPGKLDVDRLRADWSALLAQVYGSGDWSARPVVVHAQYVRTAPGSANWAQLAHRVRYDLRGFGEDYERAPILHAPEAGLVVLEGGRDGYRVVSVVDLARQWMHVRGQRDIRSWGLLAKRDAYADLVGIERYEEPEPDRIEEQDVVITRRAGLRWDKEAGAVRWISEQRAALVVAGIEIPIPEGVGWGRLGLSQWVAAGWTP